MERLIAQADHITLVVRAARGEVPCPSCTQLSLHIHSYYERRLADLPWNGIPVEVRLRTRRFFCNTEECARRIFTERLPQTAATYARRTQRMAQALFWLGLALGGEAGARTAQRLGLRVSGDTLLRHLRRMAQKSAPIAHRVLGIDDWACRKGQRYGTIVCDLERRCLVDLLPDRQSQTVTEWLRAHAPPEIISRDRAGAYAEAARQGAAHAIQVADRFHLLRNLREAGGACSDPSRAADRRSVPATHSSSRSSFSPPSSKHNFHRLAATQPRTSTGAIHPLPTSGRVASARRFQTGYCFAARTEP